MMPFEEPLILAGGSTDADKTLNLEANPCRWTRHLLVYIHNFTHSHLQFVTYSIHTTYHLPNACNFGEHTDNLCLLGMTISR